MMYEYLLTNFNSELLHYQIAKEFGSLIVLTKIDDNKLTVETTRELNENELESLNSLISNHQSNYLSTFDYIFISTRNTQQQNISFGQSLLHDWMRKNTIEGMTIVQSLWIFSRFENFEVDFGLGPKKVDLFKMFYSGAIPTAYFCILQVQPDPMTENYHWLTQERLDWVKQKIESYLGSQLVAYIQNLNNQILNR